MQGYFKIKKQAKLDKIPKERSDWLDLAQNNPKEFDKQALRWFKKLPSQTQNEILKNFTRLEPHLVIHLLILTFTQLWSSPMIGISFLVHQNDKRKFILEVVRDIVESTKLDDLLAKSTHKNNELPLGLNVKTILEKIEIIKKLYKYSPRWKALQKLNLKENNFDIKHPENLKNVKINYPKLARLALNFLGSSVFFLNLGQPIVPKTPFHETLTETLISETETTKLSASYNKLATSLVETYQNTGIGLPFGIDPEVFAIAGLSLDSEFGTQNKQIEVKNPPKQGMLFISGRSYVLGYNKERYGLDPVILMPLDEAKIYTDKKLDKNLSFNPSESNNTLIFISSYGGMKMSQYLVLQLPNTSRVIFPEDFANKSFDNTRQSKIEYKDGNKMRLSIPVKDDFTESNYKDLKIITQRTLQFKSVFLNPNASIPTQPSNHTIYHNTSPIVLTKNKNNFIPVPKWVDPSNLNVYIKTNLDQEDVNIFYTQNGIYLSVDDKYFETYNEARFDYSISFDSDLINTHPTDKYNNIHFNSVIKYAAKDAQPFDFDVKTYAPTNYSPLIAKLDPKIQEKIKLWKSEWKTISKDDYPAFILKVAKYVQQNTSYGWDNSYNWTQLGRMFSDRNLIENNIIRLLNNVESKELSINCFLYVQTITSLVQIITDGEINALITESKMLNPLETNILQKNDHFVGDFSWKNKDGALEEITINLTPPRKPKQISSSNQVAEEFKQNLVDFVQKLVKETKDQPEVLFALLVIPLVLSKFSKYNKKSNPFVLIDNELIRKFCASKEFNLCVHINENLSQIDKKDQLKFIQILQEEFKKAEFLQKQNYKSSDFTSRLLYFIIYLKNNTDTDILDHLNKLKKTITESSLNSKKEILKTLDLINEIDWDKSVVTIETYEEIISKLTPKES